MINIPNIDYGVLYNQISKLRQSQDIDWIIGFLPERTFESIADIGCGSGQFIKSMMQKGKIRKLAVGIEKNPSMINMAQKNLSNYDNVHFYLTDILSNPKIETSFDLITMMSVLHWTYPRENKAFEWIRNHLQFDGVFCFTTYHPLDSINGIGGTDHLVLEALTEVGLPKRFPDKFVPIGTRTRSIDDIYQLVKDKFHIEAVESKMATMRVVSADEYVKYHLGTFGNYYKQVVPKPLEQPFFEALGKVAMKRMNHHGYVTNIEVRVWRCRVN